jgi:DNA-binding LacI/PurR family transcriptional regulator
MQETFAVMAVTIKDVARQAGVDVSTVSRALNDSYGVNKETRKRILAVAQRLNYRPNRVARGLVTGQTYTLGLIVSDIRNPFFAEVARGAQDAANRAGCDLILCNADLDPAAQLHYVRSLLSKRVDGILMNSVASFSLPEKEELAGCGVPIVLLNRPRQIKVFSTVHADNYQGGLLAGEYLKRLGHRQVAHLTGPRQHGNLTDRAQGFLKVCPEALVLYGEHTFAGGCAMAKKLFSMKSEVTAVFAASDAIAFGVIRAAIEHGLSIPRDLSLLGFDDVELSGIIQPPLTTIHQPKYEMGEAAVEILVKSAYHSKQPVVENRVLGVHLVERQSCRPLL